MLVLRAAQHKHKEREGLEYNRRAVFENRRESLHIWWRTTSYWYVESEKSIGNWKVLEPLLQESIVPAFFFVVMKYLCPILEIPSN